MSPRRGKRAAGKLASDRHALHNARVIEAVKRAAEHGERQRLLEYTEGSARPLRIIALNHDQ